MPLSSLVKDIIITEKVNQKNRVTKKLILEEPTILNKIIIKL